MAKNNIRLEFKQDANGEATITQENHYYPFGMRFSGEVFANNDNDFRYNGKELQDDFGLDWYDYGARFYDAQLGRWHVVDPQAERYNSISPYVYVANNPLLFIDPNGEEIDVSSKKDEETGKTTVTFTFNIKVKNSAGVSKQELTKLMDGISGQIKDSFKGNDRENNFEYESEVNMEIDNDAGDGDFYIDVVNEVKDAKGNKIAATGKAKKIGNTQENRFQILAPGKSAGFYYDDVTQESAKRTGAHELGHGGGLRHQKSFDEENNISIGRNNLMYYTSGKKGTFINILQLRSMRKLVNKQQKDN